MENEYESLKTILYNIYHMRTIIKTLKFKKIPELKRFNPNKINNFIY